MGRAEEQARIREVLIALGGSPEVLDDENDPSSKGPVTLDSRIAAYTRLQTGARAPTRHLAGPDEADSAAPPEGTRGKAERRREVVPQSTGSARIPRDRSARVRARPSAVTRVRPVAVRAARALASHFVHAALAAARLLIGVIRALTRLAVHGVRLFLRFVPRAARSVGLVLRRAAAALTQLLRFAIPSLGRAAATLVHSAAHAVRLLASAVLRAAGGLGRELSYAPRSTPPDGSRLLYLVPSEISRRRCPAPRAFRLECRARYHARTNGLRRGTSRRP